MRVASYNVHGCLGWDRRRDPIRVARVIGELQCDVIGLQEVWSRLEPELLEEVAKRFDYHVIPGFTLRDRRGDYGNAFLSRWPPTSIVRHELRAKAREPRGALEIRIAREPAELRLIVTHLSRSARERAAQTRELLEEVVRPDETPWVLFGDFNEWWPRSGVLRDLNRVLGPSIAPRTFPSVCPLLALDRFWVRPASLLRHLRVHRSATARRASDHLPVVAELDF